MSTEEQDHALQIDALVDGGVHPDTIIVVTGSVAKDRPLLESLLTRLSEGDTLVVRRLDRLQRLAPDLTGLFKRSRNAALISGPSRTASTRRPRPGA